MYVLVYPSWKSKQYIVLMDENVSLWELRKPNDLFPLTYLQYFNLFIELLQPKNSSSFCHIYKLYAISGRW